MGTLEWKIEKDRKELQGIRNDLIYETSIRRRLRQRETKITLRIERNIEKLHQLRLEDMKLRKKMAEVLHDARAVQGKISASFQGYI